MTKLKHIVNFITSNWNVAAFLLGANSWLWVMKGFWPTPPIAHGIGIGFGVTSIGLVFKFQWARWSGIALLAFLSIYRFTGLFTRGFSWTMALYIFCFAAIAYGLWKNPDNGFFDDMAPDEAEETKEDKPLISLVHLRSQHRYLEETVLAHALSDAWGLKIHGGEDEAPEDSDGFVTGDDALFIVMVRKPLIAFMVHNLDRSYFEDAEEVAENVPNLRFAEIIRDHVSWLAVDLMRAGNSDLEENEAYRMIGKAISALADDHVMAILCPQHNFLNLWSSEVEAQLCSDSPLDALKMEVKPAVIGVPDGEIIESAIAEARQRWPEFVAAFKNRAPDDERFIVKASFVGENEEIEHMWLRVFGLEPEYIHGHLLNQPIHTTKLKEGSQVEVPVENVSDWLCPDSEGNPLGNFTHKAVEAAANPKPKS